MGAVVVLDLAPAGAVYGGVPARVLRATLDTGKYFRRTRGFVGPTDSDREDVDPDGEKA